MRAREAALIVVLAFILAASAKPGNARDDARIVRGKAAFVKAGCWGCHARGENALNQDRPLKGPGFVRRYPQDAEVVKQVRAGSPRRGMPAYSKERLNDRDLADIIIYIRSLSSGAVVPDTVRK